jgi:predicted GIY-YIG superfamily endonuclease
MSENSPRPQKGGSRSDALHSDLVLQPQMRDAVQAILSKHRFPAFKPAAELMSELKGASASARAGVYVHAFKGGRAFYVGISVDVRKRYFQHLKNFKDIEYSTVLAVPRDKQFLLEFELIGELMRRKIPLRNLLRPDLEYSQDDIDLIVSELGDSQGVSDESNYYRGPHTVKDAALERSLDAGHPLVVKHAEMLSHPLYTKSAAKVFARYIRSCIPLPALTERSF